MFRLAIVIGALLVAFLAFAPRSTRVGEARAHAESIAAAAYPCAHHDCGCKDAETCAHSCCCADHARRELEREIERPGSLIVAPIISARQQGDASWTSRAFLCPLRCGGRTAASATIGSGAPAWRCNGAELLGVRRDAVSPEEIGRFEIWSSVPHAPASPPPRVA